jgi:hypothetical protein
VLVLVGPHAPREGADVRLTVAGSCWRGLEAGHGRLTCRQVEVIAGGRRSAARQRRVRLWLPAPEGGVAPVDDASTSTAPGTARAPVEPAEAAEAVAR